MEFRIKTYNDSKGVYAEVIDEKGDCICIGEGNTHSKSVQVACLALSEILENRDKKLSRVRIRSKYLW